MHASESHDIETDLSNKKTLHTTVSCAPIPEPMTMTSVSNEDPSALLRVGEGGASTAAITTAAEPFLFDRMIRFRATSCPGAACLRVCTRLQERSSAIEVLAVWHCTLAEQRMAFSILAKIVNRMDVCSDSDGIHGTHTTHTTLQRRADAGKRP